MKIKQTESNYVQPTAGLSHCVVKSVIDVGSMANSFQEGKMQRNLMIIFALPKQLNEETGEMLEISKFFTASLHEKSNLYGFITDLGITVDGEYDTLDLLGVNAMVNILERTKDNGDKRMNVSTVVPLMEGVEAVTVETSKFELDNYVQAEWDALSDGIKNMIMKSPEYKALAGPLA